MKKKLEDLKRHESVSASTAEKLMLALGSIESHPTSYHSEFWGGTSRFDFPNRRILPGLNGCLAAHIVVMFADELTPRDIRGPKVGQEALRLLGDTNIAFLFRDSYQWPRRYILRSGYVHNITVEGLRAGIESYIEKGSLWIE